MKKLIPKSNFSIFHDLWSGFKVLEMGWEVKKIVRGQSKHGLWGSNLKTGKFLPEGAQEQIYCTIFGALLLLWPPSGGFDQKPSESDGLGPQILYI